MKKKTWYIVDFLKKSYCGSYLCWDRISTTPIFIGFKTKRKALQELSWAQEKRFNDVYFKATVISKIELDQLAIINKTMDS